MGAITDVVRRYVPVSYQSLVGTSNIYFGGITELQALADFVKFRLFSTSVSSSQESTVYNASQVQLLGILTTLQFIPPAVEYWGKQLSSESTVDPAENVTYRDPRPELWRIFDRLVTEAGILGSELGIGVLGAK